MLRLVRKSANTGKRKSLSQSDTVASYCIRYAQVRSIFLRLSLINKARNKLAEGFSIETTFPASIKASAIATVLSTILFATRSC